MTKTEFPPGYVGITRLLNRMAYPRCEHNLNRTGDYHKRFCKVCSLIKVTKIPREKNSPLYFHTPQVIGLRNTTHEHERACADVYVTYHLSWTVRFWETVPADEYLQLGLKPDRASTIEGRIIFWEVDKGTETLSVIRKKVERYIQLSQLHPNQKFYVIFTASKDRARSILLDVLPPFKRGNQFLVAEHKSVVERPMEAVFVSPLDPTKWLSIFDLSM